MPSDRLGSLKFLKLSEETVAQQVAPLFSRALSLESIYLANHSLGRPLDLMQDDLLEGLSAWYEHPEIAWDAWLREREYFRGMVAQLTGAERPDLIVPKTSAGEGLRTVLNTLPAGARVLSTCGEFRSIDVILRQYEELGRITVTRVAAGEDGNYHVGAFTRHIEQGIRLVVVSQVIFDTGQVIEGLDQLADSCRRHGALLLVDAYHAVGAIPVDVKRQGADFLIGGCYKYLRGGPGSGFLYISPRVLDGGWRSPDRGWFADPEDAQSGDALLGDTPPVLTWYQSRSGLEFTLALGVEQLRAYGMQQLGALRGYLHAAGVGDVRGGDAGHGAFLSIRSASADGVVAAMTAAGVVCNARGEWLRLCPDCLTTDAELRRAAQLLGEAMRR
ncbi:aminotransferase class V-fold PLP-dependent enzyme [Silvibacterium acidisoli]|uniref:aminotransferase class V-fold PLP-dependent enzyme n=1 Tax=Acidobacteriaceae bacterium ZG23-2 TaxID=2883246 RepID=UPI00406CCD61